MKTETEVMYNKNHDVLHTAGWAYLGCDYWIDPVTNVKVLSHTAHLVQAGRARREKMLKSLNTPSGRHLRLLPCSDWECIRNEIRRQLKPYGLTLKTKSNYKKWGDQLVWTVEKLPNPRYDKYLREMEAKGIDPWNIFT